MNEKTNWFRIKPLFVILVFFSFSQNYLFAEDFDPSLVRSKDCNSKNFNCGYSPATTDRSNAIPLSRNSMMSHRGLPSKMDLSENMPPIGSQGSQGSCVAWATAYAAKSYQEKKEHNWSYDPPFLKGSGEHVFSPAFIYNQINNGRDQGSIIENAMDLMVNKGAAPWKYMPYDQKDYRKQPSPEAIKEAKKYKAKSYRRVNFTNPDGIKAEINAGNPVVIGMLVDDGFYKLKTGIYDKSNGATYGGHAMTIVGYDDSKVSSNGQKGAYRLINSWGTNWGDKGYGWISYKQFAKVARSALVMYDQTETKQIEDVKITTNTTVQAPAEVHASSGSYSDKVLVSWSKVSNAVSYLVQRAESDYPDEFVDLGYATTEQYEDKAIAQESIYKYRIVAVGEKARSDASKSPMAEGYAIAKTEDSIPDKVVGLIGTVMMAGNKPQVILKWTESQSAQNYTVIRWDDANKKWKFIANSVKGATYSDNSPIAGKINYYNIKANNRSGSSEWANSLGVSVSKANIVDVVDDDSEVTVPSKVSGLVASRGDYPDKVEISWNKAPGAKTYHVYRYNFDEGKWQGPFSTSASNYVDAASEIKNGAIYFYSIIASNSNGNSEYSDFIEGYVNPEGVRGSKSIPTPKNLKASMKDGSVVLNWDAVKSKDNFEYYVYRKNESEKDYKFVATVNSSKTTYTEKVPGNPGDLYLYIVRSKLQMGGESGNSNAVSGFVNKEIKVAKKRSFSDPELNKLLQGEWTGTDWDGKSKPREVKITVKGEGTKFTADVFVNNKKMKSFTGSYLAGTKILQANGFKLELSSQLQDTAQISLNDKKISSEQISFSITKE